MVEYGQSGEECYGTYDSTTPTNSTGLGYTTACIHSGANSGTNGNNTVWYNYAAASAGTIVTPGSSTDTTEATESICPKGWKLPSGTQIQDLITAIGSSPSTFNPILGGLYLNGNNSTEDVRGYWWSTSNNTSIGPQRTGVGYYNGSLYRNDSYRRYFGLHVRCVLR